MTAAEKRQAAHEQFLAVASLPDAQPGYLAALIDFLTRKNDLSEAEEWLNKLEAKLNAKPMDDPGAIAQLIELRMRHGSGNRCEKWLALGSRGH